MTIDEMIDALERMRAQIEDESGMTRQQAGKIEVRCAYQPRHTLNGPITTSAALKMGGAWSAMLGMSDSGQDYGGGDVFDRDGEIVDVDAEQDARDAEIDED